MDDADAILKTLIEIEVEGCKDTDLLNLIYKLLIVSKES